MKTSRPFVEPPPALTLPTCGMRDTRAPRPRKKLPDFFKSACFVANPPVGRTQRRSDQNITTSKTHYEKVNHNSDQQPRSAGQEHSQSWRWGSSSSSPKPCRHRGFRSTAASHADGVYHTRSASRAGCKSALVDH